MTLLEILAVMTIIGVLVVIIIPNFGHSSRRAREAVLKENLFQIRDAIQKYLYDKQKYPTSLEDLVTNKYLRDVPFDPIAKTKDWELVHFEPEEVEDYDPDIAEGIIDVKSRANGTGLDGVLYREW